MMICLLFLYFDNFKQVNYVYGHLQGDEILNEFVKLLRWIFRDSDIIFRYGGDEFVVLLTNKTLDKVEVVDKI